jgi:hypothetical protein
VGQGWAFRVYGLVVRATDLLAGEQSVTTCGVQSFEYRDSSLGLQKREQESNDAPGFERGRWQERCCRKIIFIEIMKSVRKLKAFREGPKCRPAARRAVRRIVFVVVRNPPHVTRGADG